MKTYYELVTELNRLQAIATRMAAALSKKRELSTEEDQALATISLKTKELSGLLETEVANHLNYVKGRRGSSVPAPAKTPKYESEPEPVFDNVSST